MPRYSWKVGSGLTLISNVQNIVISKGRVQVQDPFKSSTATVQGRDLDSLPNIEIGDPIDISADDGFGNVFNAFVGVVADVQLNYGQVSNMDTWTIFCEDALARVGRSLTTSTFNWASGITTGQAVINTVSNATGGAVTVSVDGFVNESLVSSQSLPNTNALEILNQLATTEQGYLYAKSPSEIGFKLRSEIGQWFVAGDFSDNSLITINSVAIFDQVVFRSQADSYADEVVIEPAGLAAQTSGTGPRRSSFKSFDQTTTQAQNLADYVLATLVVQDSVPSTISAISEVQLNNVAMTCAVEAGAGVRCGLILRGESYNLFVEGSTITATPDQTRFTLNVISSDALNFFILDSTIFGVLDTDRLGF
jgi:hypothetical protein